MHDFYDFEYELGDPRIAALQRDSLHSANAIVVSWPGPFRTLEQLFPECMDKAFMVPFCFEPMPKLVEQAAVARPRELLYAALTGPHKNHENLIRALGVLRRRGEPVLFVHCPGSHRPGRLQELLALARSEGVDDWIHFHGFISRESLRSLYCEVAGIVAPTKYEAFSGTVLEAFQYGKPVACSRIPQLTAFNETVGAHVRYFDPDKPDEIADAMVDLTTNPEPYRLGSLRARAALELVTPARTARHYRDVFAFAAGAGPRPVWAPYEPLISEIADGFAVS
jgi:glycosyltransferase involved in cell wall biosynthesis